MFLCSLKIKQQSLTHSTNTCVLLMLIMIIKYGKPIMLVSVDCSAHGLKSLLFSYVNIDLVFVLTHLPEAQDK